jgi:hypothetical protein
VEPQSILSAFGVAAHSIRETNYSKIVLYQEAPGRAARPPTGFSFFDLELVSFLLFDGWTRCTQL